MSHTTGVNAKNKRRVSAAGGIPKLIALLRRCTMHVKIECVAALANLAVTFETSSTSTFISNLLF